MQNQISVFQFQATQNVRVEIKNGEPWFCLRDVTEILNVEMRSTEYFNLNQSGIEKIELLDSLNRKQTATFINEPNLYRVIFRSNKSEAVKFQDWIFEEVIPQIRKTGSYQNPQHGQGYLNDWEQEQIRQAVKERSTRTGETTQAIYIKLHAYMGCDSYMNICQCDFQTALNFLASIENAPTLFEAQNQPAIDEDTMLIIARLLLFAQEQRQWVRRYLPAFDNLGLDKQGTQWSFVHDTEPMFRKIRKLCLDFLPQDNGQHWAYDTPKDKLRRKLIATI